MINLNSKKSRYFAYKKGFALKRHIENAHSGVFLETCPACMDLKLKLTELKNTHKVEK